MKNIFVVIVCLLLGLKSNIHAQNTALDAWKGIWKGKLEIFTGEGKKQEIPMELHILPTDSAHKFTFKIIYDKSPRDYTLVVKDATKGIYTLDENNGIKMDMVLLNNSFVSCFEVMDNILISSYRLENNQIISEIFSCSKKQALKTGNMPEKDIPEVISYPPKVLQRAILRNTKVEDDFLKQEKVKGKKEKRKKR
ncbi:hypothetical protein AD998_07235 [bacterium 336/3]|nr:hypothetical protein AD998_07235 [bacterium 336/3]